MGTSVAHSRHGPRPSALSLVFLLMLSSLPVAAWGEEDQSIATLRRMGKAFASIAEKASPAVVGVRATRVVKADSKLREYSSGDSNPFSEDFFDYFFRRRTPRHSEPAEPREKSEPKEREIGRRARASSWRRMASS